MSLKAASLAYLYGWIGTLYCWYEQIVYATTNTKQNKKRNHRKYDNWAYTDVHVTDTCIHSLSHRSHRHTHTYTHIQPRCQTMCSWLVRWMSRAWLLTNCRICFVSYGNWLRLYRKWRCKIRALTSRIAESLCLSVVVTTLRFFWFLSFRRFFSFLLRLPSSFPTLVLMLTWVFVCVTFYWRRRRKNWIQIWFNEIQSQQMFENRNQSSKKERNVHASVLRCKMRLKISQCYVNTCVKCFFGSASFQAKNDKYIIYFVHALLRWYIKFNPIEPIRKKRSRELSTFFCCLNSIHSHIDFDFNFYWDLSIHSDQSFVFVYMYCQHDEQKQTVWALYTHRETVHSIEKANHFVRKSIKSKMEWLMADMGILLILWKCGL